jgi:hypothetical protein
MQFVTSLFFISIILSPLTASAQIKDWTVMVFENGNNDLDEYITKDVNEMETVGSSDRVNVVAEWGSYSRQKVVRMKMQRDNDADRVTSPVIQDRGRADMGDYREVVDFVKWSVQNFPAKHYFLVISDHGAGWRASKGQIVSIDSFSGHGIHLPQLAIMGHQVQKLLGKNLDLMGFDACLMAMSEVAAEFWGLADFLVASQEVEPGYGWEYRDMLGFFVKYPQSKASAFGQAIVQSYVASYQGGSQGRAEVTLSLTDLSQLDLVAKDVRDFAQLVTQKASSDQKLAVSKAFAAAQHYYNSDYIDLMGFYDLVRRDKKLESVLSQQWFTDAMSHLKKAILVNGVTTKYSRSNGLSIWGPDQGFYKQYGKEYAMTRFDRGTKWSAMLTSLYQNLQMRNIRLSGLR